MEGPAKELDGSVPIGLKMSLSEEEVVLTGVVALAVGGASRVGFALSPSPVVLALDPSLVGAVLNPSLI